MAKKSFRDDINPAMSFISQESISRAETETPATEETTKPGKPPKGYKANPMYIETKSRRLQLLVQPSLYEKAKKRAQAEGTSVNDLVSNILHDALDGEEE